MVYEYDAWGNILSVKNANGVNIANPNSIANIQSLRYRGYCYDTDTGLYYLQSRYYDPVTHRFINADGYVSTGTGVLGYNMFAYCLNNPVNLCDYNGERVYPFNYVGPLRSGDIRLGLNGVYTEGVSSNNRTSATTTTQEVVESYDDNKTTFFDVIGAAFSAFELKLGFGAGLYGGVSYSLFDFSGGARATLLTLKIDNTGIDLGTEGIYGVTFGPVSFIDGYYHSFFCDKYNDINEWDHDITTCTNGIQYTGNEPSYSISYGFETYLILGANASISWNEDTFIKHLRGY